MKAYSNHTDEDLLMRMASNDPSAFTLLYNKYWKLLFCIACKKLDNSMEAEEIVQDIFLDLWQRRASLELEGPLSSYLSVAVNYKVIKMMARRQLYAKYQAARFVADEGAGYRMEPLLEFKEVKSRLFQLVSALPRKCRLVFRMSRDELMSGREIAQRLNISEKTVESHISRALVHLRTGLDMPRASTEKKF